MSHNFFQNKRILITGIDGFVGSALSQILEEKGALVYGISQNIENKRIKKADIIDFLTINKFISENKIQIIFHLAGEALVETGQQNPHHVFRVNIDGTVNILESARLHALERVIIASTVHVYGDHKPPYFERFTPRPSRPYETSKACADLIAQSYADSYNLPVLIPRFVNIYGSGDRNFTRLIPKTIKAVLSDVSPEMWGGKAIRDYLYIDDAIEAYLLLAQGNIVEIGKNRIFNFGSGNKISVENLMQKVITISKKNCLIKRIEDKRIAEVTSQYVSSNRAKKVLGWNARVTLDEGLSKTIAWYKKYLSD